MISKVIFVLLGVERNLLLPYFQRPYWATNLVDKWSVVWCPGWSSWSWSAIVVLCSILPIGGSLRECDLYNLYYLCHCCNTLWQHTLYILLVTLWNKIVITHLNQRNNTEEQLLLFHTHDVPNTLKTITVINNQSIIIQYNSHTFSITVTSLYLVTKMYCNHLKIICRLILLQKTFYRLFTPKCTDH